MMLSLLFVLAMCSVYVSLVVRVFAIVVLWFKLFCVLFVCCCLFAVFVLVVVAQDCRTWTIVCLFVACLFLATMEPRPAPFSAADVRRARREHLRAVAEEDERDNKVQRTEDFAPTDALEKTEEIPVDISRLTCTGNDDEPNPTASSSAARPSSATSSSKRPLVENNLKW